MSVNGYKVLVILSLATIMVVYNNCGAPFGTPSPLYFESNVYGGSALASYEAFETTVYPITRANCVSCHSTQQPQHASADVKTAHDAIVSNFKVNFNDIPSSRMVKKLRDDNHNCWGDCEDNALEMEAAIKEWKDKIKDTGDDTTDPVIDTAIYTAQSKFLSEEAAIATNAAKINVISINLESAILMAPMVKETNAVDGTYITVPNNLNTTLANNTVGAGTASINFTVRQASNQYRIWALVNAPNTSDNGFYSNISTTTSGIKEWEIPVTNGWEWRQLPNLTFNLPLGVHNLQIRERKDGTKIKKIVITSDNAFSAITAAELTAFTVTYDIAEAVRVPGVTYKVDVIDYDSYSYKFQNPRIVTTSVNIKVKKAKILVNNSYNPQHSTFTLINKVATPTDGKLLDYAMLVIKDKGLEGDKISFSFETLKVDDGIVENPVLVADQEAFRDTVYVVSRASCVSCHTGQNPPHAHDDFTIAHDAVITSSLVNFTTPANSRLVTKTRGRHNCGTQVQCDAIANSFQAAIIEWKNRRP